MPTIYTLETYICSRCGYVQTSGGECPACAAKDIQSVLTLSASPTVTVQVPTDTEIAALQVNCLNPDGTVQTQQVGSHYELQINQSTGAVTSVPVAEYAPVTRAMTSQEITDFTTECDATVNAISASIVSTTTS